MRTAERHASQGDGEQHGDADAQMVPGCSIVSGPDGSMALGAREEGSAQHKGAVAILAVCFCPPGYQALQAGQMMLLPGVAMSEEAKRGGRCGRPMYGGSLQACNQVMPRWAGTTSRQLAAAQASIMVAIPMGMIATIRALYRCHAEQKRGLHWRQLHAAEHRRRCARPCAPSRRCACCPWAWSPTTPATVTEQDHLCSQLCKHVWCTMMASDSTRCGCRPLRLSLASLDSACN